MEMHVAIQPFYEVGAANPHKFALYVASFFRLVPEEKLPLCQLFFLRFCRIYRLQSVRVKPCVPCLRADSHRCWGEILHLFEFEVKPFGYYRQFGHVFFLASRMAADEVGDYLLAEIFTFVDFIKNSFEFLKLAE